MSWFVQGSDSKIYEFLCLVTEPVIQPFRSLLSRVSAPVSYTHLDVYKRQWMSRQFFFGKAA